MTRRRVLIVDDERLLGEVLRDFLSDDYDAELVTTAASAIRRLTEDSSIEVIICDLQLPDGSGLDVLHAYRAAWPGRDRRMVFITGGIEDVAPAAIRVLQKPLDVDALARLIETVAAEN